MFKTSPYYINSETCPHWIPISKECYVCSREKKREENKFVNCSVHQNKHINQTNHMESIFKNNNEYIDPNNHKKVYTHHNNKRINNFNSRCNNDVFQSRDLPNVNFYGSTTRINNRNKIAENSYNLHLERSMVQPDYRQGNRFYEYKPHSTR